VSFWGTIDYLFDRTVLHMLRALPTTFKTFALLALFLTHSWVLAQTQTTAVDETFLALREATTRKKVADVDRLAAQIPASYPLYAFAEYWKLKVRQPEVSDAAIKSFLERYEGQFVADRLRNDWLLMLGKQGDWKQFNDQLPLFALADDPQVDCYAVASKAAQGVSVKADARQVLLRNPANAAGEGCMALAEMMHKTNQFSSNDLWDVAHILAEGKRFRAAIQLAEIMNANPNALDKAMQEPAKVLAQSNPKPLTELAHAAQARAGFWGNAVVMPHAAVQGAAACAQRLANDCNSWFKPGGVLIKLPDNLQGLGSDNALEWAVRGALRAQDWPLVAELTQRLPSHLQQEPTWTYWQAKALTAVKQADLAKPLYERIATGWGFYGLLAREALGLPLTLPTPGEKPQEAAVAAVIARDEVLRMNTFFKLGLRWEGNREWNWMVRPIADAQVATYAEAGRRLGHIDRMINTSERGKAQPDFTQRFPMPFIKQAQPIADSLRLDTNWVYGLMRQESRFISDVRSSASARGLMQVMPATAAFVAKKINYPNYSLERISEPEVNLTLGHNYLAMVLADLDNLPILATAAYNAGPGRPRTWRASLARTVEGAIFAETIPFNETRGYVKNVLANAALYGVVTGNKPRPLSAWLGVVAPKGVTPTQLP
jgi:soluble lytic murein transglycosylase